MEDDKLFTVAGRWSKAWYLKMVKDNPERRGFTWIRKVYTVGAPQAEKIKSIFAILVDQRYLDPVGKPDGHGSTPYKVTSLGHRFLEEHKSDLVTGEIAASKLVKVTSDPLIGKKMPVTDNPEFRATFEEPVETERKKNAGFILKRKGYDGIHGPSEPIGDDDDIEADDIVLGKSDMEGNWDLIDKRNNDEIDNAVKRKEAPTMTEDMIRREEKAKVAIKKSILDQLNEVTTPTLPTAMHVALTDYLMETYGHKVTVVELMKYISNKEAGDGEETW